MAKWQIVFWSGETGVKTVEKWLQKLTTDQLKSVAKELRMLREVGNSLRLPHSKPLGKGLFELREHWYGYRIYYGFCGKELIILLAAGHKTSQKKDIKIARERLSNLTGVYKYETKEFPNIS